MAQSVKCLTLGFGSGRDLTVREFAPCLGLRTDIAEPAWDSVSPSLSTPPMFVHAHWLSLSLPPSFKNKL